MPAENALVFTSGPETRHGREMLANPRVSGGIVLETKVVGKIRGVQVSGVAQRIGEEENGRRGEMENSCSPVPLFAYSPVQIQQKASAFKKAYLKRFPFALAAKLDLWVLQLEYVKMTDNRLGFGKKIEWRRGEEEKGRKGE
jgi:uncharacterized protein YhbP (UPF0306 family)